MGSHSSPGPARFWARLSRAARGGGPCVRLSATPAPRGSERPSRQLTPRGKRLLQMFLLPVSRGGEKALEQLHLPPLPGHHRQTPAVGGASRRGSASTGLLPPVATRPSCRDTRRAPLGPQPRPHPQRPGGDKLTFVPVAGAHENETVAWGDRFLVSLAAGDKVSCVGCAQPSWCQARGGRQVAGAVHSVIRIIGVFPGGRRRHTQTLSSLMLAEGPMVVEQSTQHPSSTRPLFYFPSNIFRASEALAEPPLRTAAKAHSDPALARRPAAEVGAAARQP